MGYSLPQDWATDFALFMSGVKVNPNNVKLRNNLGMELKAAGRLEEAQHQYLVCCSTDLCLHTPPSVPCPACNG